MKQLKETEFLDLFDPSIHDKILASAARYPDCEGIVCFENQDLGIVCRRGLERKALVVGPSNTYTLSDCQKPGARLGDVPSRFQYPTFYVDYQK